MTNLYGPGTCYVPVGGWYSNRRVNAAVEKIHSKFRRRKNWTGPSYGDLNYCAVKYHGRYSSRCRFSRYSYTPIIRSVAVLHNAKTATIWFGTAKYKLKAPKGERFAVLNDRLHTIKGKVIKPCFIEDLLKVNDYS